MGIVCSLVGICGTVPKFFIRAPRSLDFLAMKAHVLFTPCIQGEYYLVSDEENVAQGANCKVKVNLPTYTYSLVGRERDREREGDVGAKLILHTCYSLA